MRIAVISDTHMPRGARRLPEACVEQLRAADLIVHAGDLLAISALRELETYGRVLAVHGNIDEFPLRATLPAERRIDAGGLVIGLVHDAGPAKGRLARLRRRFPDAAAVVFGHSHVPLHERVPDGFQIFNPGSPTDRRRGGGRGGGRGSQFTMGVAMVEGGELTFELVDVG